MAIDPLHTGGAQERPRADAARYAAFQAPRLPEHVVRPGRLDDRRRDRRGRRPYQVYTLTHSTAPRRSARPCIADPAPLRPSDRRRDRQTQRPPSVLLRPEPVALVAGTFVLNSQLAHPRVWVLFVLRSSRRDLQSGRPAMNCRPRASCRTTRLPRRSRSRASIPLAGVEPPRSQVSDRARRFPPRHQNRPVTSMPPRSSSIWLLPRLRRGMSTARA